MKRICAALAAFVLAAACGVSDSNPPPVGELTIGETEAPPGQTTGDVWETDGEQCQQDWVEYECRGFVAGVYRDDGGEGDEYRFIINSAEHFECLDWGDTPTFTTCGPPMDISWSDPSPGDPEHTFWHEVANRCEAKCEALGRTGWGFPVYSGLSLEWKFDKVDCEVTPHADGQLWGDPEEPYWGVGTADCDIWEDKENPIKRYIRPTGDMCPPQRCSEEMEAIECAGWDPEALVGYTDDTTAPYKNREANLDIGLRDALVNCDAESGEGCDAARQLYKCDSGRWEMSWDDDTGGAMQWQMAHIEEGDLLYELGFRDGDNQLEARKGSAVPWVSLESFDGLLEAVGNLKDESLFRVKGKTDTGVEFKVKIHVLDCEGECDDP